MMNTLKRDVVSGAKTGLYIYGAQKTMQVADGLVSKFVGTALPAYLRVPLVGLGVAMVGKKVLGSKLSELVTGVAFASVISSVADPMINPVLISAGVLPALPTAAPTTQGYLGTARGYSKATGAYMGVRATRGYAAVGV
jgi:hypothetical protein